MFGAKLIFQLVLSAIYGLEVFGFFATAQSIVYFLEKIKNMQVWQIQTTEMRDGNANELFWIFWIYELTLSLLVFVLFFLLNLILSDVLEQEVLNILQIYQFYLLFGFNGAALGYVRWVNRYSAILVVYVVTSMCILSLSVFSVYLGSELTINAYVTVEIIFFIVINVVAIRFAGKISWSFIRSKISSLFWEHISKIKITHSNNVVRVFTRELDVVLLSFLAGSSVVGAYKMAKNIAHLPVFITDAFYFAIFPEFVRNISDRYKMRSIIFRATIYALLFSFFIILVSWCFYYIGLAMKVDIDMLEVLFMVGLFQISISICVTTFSWAPAMFAYAEYTYLLLANLVATAIYFALFFFMFEEYGVYGVILDYAVYYAVWAGLVGGRVWKHL